MKRVICLIILITMLVHCASRLGIIQYLYQQRHAIAFHIGVISELPISLCSSDYQANQKLSLSETDTQDEIPAAFSTNHEIQLFMNAFGIRITDLDFTLLDSTRGTPGPGKYDNPSSTIFQPPKAV